MLIKALCQNPVILVIITRDISIQVGYGHHCSIFFVIPTTILVHGLQSDILILMSEKHSHVDLVLGIENMLEHDAFINTIDYSIKF